MEINRTTFFNIAAVISAIIGIFLDYNNYHQWFVIFKPLTTILILFIALINFKSAPRKFAIYISIGLVFCILGDIFLLEQSGFLYGLVAFLMAHILFSVGFISIDGFKTYWKPAMILLAFIALFYGYLSDNLGDMTIPVIAYMLVISFMVWQGISLYIWRSEKVYLWIAISAVLFLISDSILAVNQFKFNFKEAPIYNLATYWTSLLLLANAFRYFKKV